MKEVGREGWKAIGGRGGAVQEADGKQAQGEGYPLSFVVFVWQRKRPYAGGISFCCKWIFGEEVHY